MVIRPLDRKLLRDVWHLKGQALAISLVIGAGVAMFITYLSTFASLRLTQTMYYERYRFADVFTGMTRAPLFVKDRVAAIPGVARADTRVVVDVTLDVPKLSEPASARLIGIDIPHAPMLNDLFLRRGRFPAVGRADEVLVSEAFAISRSLGPGDRLGAIINGRRRELEIVGVALSPEYIYSIRPGELVPDDSRFCIIWMQGRSLAAAFNMEGGFNNLSLTLLPGASSADVIARLDRMLSIYGGLGSIPRSLQTSHFYLDSELKQLQNVGFILPVVFLAVAAFLLNVVLTRIVAVQREQIAALKALGYTNVELVWHYTKLSLLIGAAGAAIGTVFGSLLGSGMIQLYNAFFRFPVLQYHLPAAVVAGGVIVSFVAAILGAVNAVYRVAALPPAEAMRPEPPARYRHSWLERAGLARLLSAPVRMILRNVGRHPVRAATSVIGIATAITLLVLGTFFIDAIAVLMDLQFFSIERQHVTVSLVLPASARAIHEMGRLPGVLYAEPVRAVPVRLRSAHRSRITSLQGLVAQPELRRVVDVRSGPIRLPPQGLVLSDALAEVLGAGPGDPITIEVLDGRRPVRDVRVAAIVEEYMGTSAYMEIDALRHLLGEGDTISGAFLTVDPSAAGSLYRRLKRTPMVAGVNLKQTAIESFQKTLADTFYIMIFFNLLFSGIIAGGVVYNAARVSLSERSRELASLRVLGFTRGEISFILLGELAVVVVMAIPIGLVVGYISAGVLLNALSNELYRFPLVITVRTYAYATAAVLVAAALSGLAVRRRLDHLDLVAVLKTRE
ncbi:MAG: ABC transporter permease [Acidobacteria bacterium RIFCSPLOWO2_02_FULL_67_36]|nr:MAG: ABC transporter permease [Acidobacteria bacterium RIFCSPLOWO2_02_FULL_67_36]OFW23023.1 MAG: ABC transporter permease [Acidobacteria bacterium RIFCSPLOWO2_12_FULL_66_21]